MRKIIRLISLVLVLSLLGEDFVQASPEIKPVQLHLWEAHRTNIDLPESVARIEDSFDANKKLLGSWEAGKLGYVQTSPSSPAASFLIPPQLSSNRLIYLLQDAHTNPSGQVNLAKAIDLLLEKDPSIRHIFSEAGVGDNSLSFLRKKSSSLKRKQVADKYLKQGLLHGEEYLDLTSHKSFTLWGVEDPRLYIRSLEAYRKVTKDRELFQQYLDRIQITVNTLKPRIYNPSLLEFDQLHEKFLKEEIPLTDYLHALGMIPLGHTNLCVPAIGQGTHKFVCPRSSTRILGRLKSLRRWK